MTIDEMIDLSRKASDARADAAWNELEDHIATLSYGRVNEILDYLPSWDSPLFVGDTHGPLRSMCDDAKEAMEKESLGPDPLGDFHGRNE